MAKFNVLFYDDVGMIAGSVSKLFVTMGKILTEAGFTVYLAYAKKHGEAMKPFFEQAGVKLIPFDFSYRRGYEPHKVMDMRPSFEEIVKQYKIHCACLCVFAHYQYPLNTMPASFPFILISPFGHYSSNGNVSKTYVSGRSNLERLIKRGVKNVETFFNPLADVPEEFLVKPPVGNQAVFGRIGRGEDAIFDPIAVRAFKKLEDVYGDLVKYIVVAPPPAWRELAGKLEIKNMEFRGHITDLKELYKFYQEIDVFAHARIDGETVGNAIGEAMLSSNPILTHKSHFHNDHLDLLNETYARWCEADDAEEYFKNMKWMVDNKAKIRGMGQLARQSSLRIFGLQSWKEKIIRDFSAACEHCYNDSFFGKVKGYTILYWQNLKAMPFLLGKLITYKLPSLYKKIRKFYYE